MGELMPRATLDDSGLHFNDARITAPFWDSEESKPNFKSIARVSISSSLIDGLLECPARAMADKYILRDIAPLDPMSPTELGSAFHKVMELFFVLPPEERNNARVREAYKRMLALEEFKHIRECEPAAAKVREWISGLWTSHMFDWKNVKVAQVHGKRKAVVPGLEMFVKGRLGGAARESLGYIDMLALDGNGDDPKHVGLVDWKTGKKPHVYNPDDKYPDFGYTRQQTMYAMLLEQQGYKVEYAHLVYPAIKDTDSKDSNATKAFIQTIPIHDKTIRERTIDEVEKSSKICDAGIDTNTWGYGPSPLCSWCPLVNICPSAMCIKKPNAVKSREEQFTAEDLKGQVEAL